MIVLDTHVWLWWINRHLELIGLGWNDLILQAPRLGVDLPEHHRAPQDRIIIATVLAHDGRLISADGKFPLYQELAGKLIS